MLFIFFQIDMMFEKCATASCYQLSRKVYFAFCNTFWKNHHHLSIIFFFFFSILLLLTYLCYYRLFRKETTANQKIVALQFHIHTMPVQHQVGSPNWAWAEPALPSWFWTDPSMFTWQVQVMAYSVYKVILDNLKNKNRQDVKNGLASSHSYVDNGHSTRIFWGPNEA